MEVPFEDRFQHDHHGVVQDAIRVRGGGDEPPLRAVNPVGDEWAGNETAGDQLPAEGEQRELAAELESLDGRAVPLPPPGLRRCEQQVRPRGEG